MNCEQVEAGLSAYLDNVLAPLERGEIAVHLHSCSRCMLSLDELRQNDVLLAGLARVGPSPALRERLFSSAEMCELSNAAGNHADSSDITPLSLFLLDSIRDTLQ
jgi:anti-sigma factor RsiW